jgi:dienelactone hydrolase
MPDTTVGSVSGYLALAPLARLVRLDYQPESAEDSWRRILAFFGAHLRSDPAPAG